MLKGHAPRKFCKIQCSEKGSFSLVVIIVMMIIVITSVL